MVVDSTLNEFWEMGAYVTSAGNSESADPPLMAISVCLLKLLPNKLLMLLENGVGGMAFGELSVNKRSIEPCL